MFAHQTWGGGSKLLMAKVQFPMDQFPRDSARQRQVRLGWLPVDREAELAVHKLTWKTINLGVPEEVAAHKLPLNTTGHRIQTQRKLVPKPRWLDNTKLYRQSFRSRAYKYNTLPGQITSQLDLKKKKKITRNYLTTRI